MVYGQHNPIIGHSQSFSLPSHGAIGNSAATGRLPLPTFKESKPNAPFLHQNARVDTPQSLYQLGKHYFEARQYLQAIMPFNRLAQLAPENLEVLNYLAFSLFATGRLDLALKTYEFALRLAPQHPSILCGIAHCHKAMGNFDAAIAFFKDTLTRDSSHIESLYNLILLDGANQDVSVMQRLISLHRSARLSSDAHIMTCFALAKLYELQGDHIQAFTYYEEGNQRQFAQTPYDEAGLFQYLDLVEKTFSQQLFCETGNVGSPDATPIFVLGMPRSGTSLIEQILASHPQVHGAGEISIMPDIAARLIPQLTGLHNPQAINLLHPGAYVSIADHYINGLRSHCPEQKPYIVDKMPNNFFHIGLIKLLLPNAKIIHCVRDSMDTCWSLYRQHFGINHPYCYDQHALGKFYLRYQQLMQHWENVLPHAIYEVQYEKLVAAPEKEVSALLEHCALPWDESCLKFYDTKRTVNTASMQQVRQPIYHSALKSWQPLEKHLTTLSEALGIASA